ncbi:12857_t:CDS:1, partial [Cetraspora pellucida]
TLTILASFFSRDLQLAMYSNVFFIMALVAGILKAVGKKIV